ncbi:arginase family protein [Embleya sp. AB8]|uniref:arginase family protein n=1 Tax=Embleya sp. AB8 TaxID=3156304 RepID=UPI003C7240E2
MKHTHSPSEFGSGSESGSATKSEPGSEPNSGSDSGSDSGSGFEHMLVVPQWQGSGTAHPERLVAGAHRLSALLPAIRRTVVAVDAEPTSNRDGVRQLDTLARTLKLANGALTEWGADPLLTIGGDCGVELAPIAAAVGRYGSRLAVVWFDAHPDLNTPAGSPSGAFHGMVLRTLLGDGPAALVPPPEQRPAAQRVVLAGVRAVDPAEAQFIEAEGIPRITVEQLADPGPLLAAVSGTGATHVYIHVDLDVLDPEHFSALSVPEPDGLHPPRLGAALRALAEEFEVAGLGITEHAPAPTSDGARDDRVLRELFAGRSAI